MMGDLIRQKERQKHKQRKMKKGNGEMGNLGKRIGIK
jgi:hypothetical protein